MVVTTYAVDIAEQLAKAHSHRLTEVGNRLLCACEMAISSGKTVKLASSDMLMDINHLNGTLEIKTDTRTWYTDSDDPELTAHDIDALGGWHIDRKWTLRVITPEGARIALAEA